MDDFRISAKIFAEAESRPLEKWTRLEQWNGASLINSPTKPPLLLAQMN